MSIRLIAGLLLATNLTVVAQQPTGILLVANTTRYAPTIAVRAIRVGIFDPMAPSIPLNPAFSQVRSPIAQLAPGSLFNIHAWIGGSLSYMDEDMVYTPTNLVECLPADEARIAVQSTAGGPVHNVSPLVTAANRCGAILQGVFPSELPEGPAEMTLFLQDGSSYGPTRIQVVSSNFIILDDRVSTPDGRPFTLTQPATSGSIVHVTGSGRGLAQPSAIHAELDGQPLAYLGHVETAPGTEQLRFRLPDHLVFAGCYTPLAIRVAGRWTSQLTTSVHPAGGPCRHPLELRPAQLAQLDAGRSIALGTLMLRSNTSIGAEPLFGGSSLSGSIRFADVRETAAWNSSEFEEGCRTEDNFFDFFTAWTTFGRVLDPGIFSLIAPARNLIKLAPNGTQAFSIDSRLPAGTYQFAAAGGLDVRPFSTRFTIPPIPSLTLPAEPLIQGSTLRLDWDVEPYSEADLISVRVGPLYPNPATVCKTRARNGELQIRIPQLAPLLPAAKYLPTQLEISVERRQNMPLLFPFELSNGASYNGLINYRFTASYPIQIGIPQ